MSTFLRALTSGKGKDEDLGGQMSFLEHLDELRKRLTRSLLFVFLAATFCWFVSARIYSFLAVPVEQALAEAQRREVPITGVTGGEKILPLSSIKENDTGRYIFAEETKIGTSLLPAGTAVFARALKDANGQLWLFTDEPLYAGNTVIPKGVRLPLDFTALPEAYSGINDKLIITSATEPFSLYVKVSLYAALCLSVPLFIVADLGLRLAGFVSTRARLCNALHRTLFDLICARGRVCLQDHLSACRQVSSRIGTGFSAPAEGRRLLRSHHYRHAGDGNCFPDAGSDVCPRPYWPGDGTFHDQNLEDGAYRDPGFGRRSLAH